MSCDLDLFTRSDGVARRGGQINKVREYWAVTLSQNRETYILASYIRQRNATISGLLLRIISGERLN